ncbi:PorT family protein [Elizabethkingia argentiflava]|uniref:PorT family protein n=1 Tax=Elizabethkingia argenteiflava TaxID=2681556 RepID=A0A845Q0C5_9FLAO|nr:outer membrane beta-barrel protein [Elizabethkingia argenteiflava]NAW52137.1 PorT family protein [Elizabethkingia argenteiflava]
MLKKKCKTLCFCLLSVGTGLCAQNRLKLDLDAGPIYSVLNTNRSNLTQIKDVGQYGVGVNLGAEYKIWKTLFVSSGISFHQKNFKIEGFERKEGKYTKETNNFLSFPLLVGGYILEVPQGNSGVWLKVAGGMYTDYWLTRKRTGNYMVFTELQEDGSFNETVVTEKYNFKENENQLNRFGYGLQGQAQLGYSFKSMNIYAAYNGYYGLSDINKANRDTDQETKIRSYMLSIGVSCKLN